MYRKKSIILYTIKSSERYNSQPILEALQSQATACQCHVYFSFCVYWKCCKKPHTKKKQNSLLFFFIHKLAILVKLFYESSLSVLCMYTIFFQSGITTLMIIFLQYFPNLTSQHLAALSKMECAAGLSTLQHPAGFIPRATTQVNLLDHHAQTAPVTSTVSLAFHIS